MIYPFHRALADLFSLQAFRPGTRDPLLPLRVRLRGEPVLFVGLGTRMLRTARTQLLQGELVIADHQLTARPAQEVLSDHLAEAARRGTSKVRHAVLLLSHGWSAELVDREDPEQLRANPELMLYRVGHPTLACGVLFRVPRPAVQEAAEVISLAGLELCRLQIPVITVLETLVHDAPESLSGADVLVADFQSLLFITAEEGRWTRIRFSSNRPGELAADIARHLRERPDPSAPLVVAGGGGLTKLVRAIQPDAQLRTPLGDSETLDLHASCER